MSLLYDFVKNLPVIEQGEGYVNKTARARDLIKRLPSPKNVSRDLDIVPDISVLLCLSTTPQLPAFLKKVIEDSQDKEIFNDEHLAGLYMNGHDYPPYIFLHEIMMQKMDSSGLLFEQVFWHEYLHAVEGIHEVRPRVFEYKVPWSSRLQGQMLEIDKKAGHQPSYDGMTALRRDFTRYMREGTALQKNASEVFARVGVLFWLKICETKEAALPYDFINLIGDSGKQSLVDIERNRNASELGMAVETFCDGSKDLLFAAMPRMIAQTAHLYGIRYFEKDQSASKPQFPSKDRCSFDF